MVKTRRGFRSIRQSMRRNEVDLLAHLRRYCITHTSLFSMAWHNALDRLEAGGMVRFVKSKGAYTGRYLPRPGAGPVTAPVRK
jgi:hypothetical protein